MDVPSENSLKRPADEPIDVESSTPKKRNTGMTEGRKVRRSGAYINPIGGTPTDPLNLNTSQDNSAYDRIKRLEECHVIPGGVHQRRFSFRTSNNKKKSDVKIPDLPATSKPDKTIEKAEKMAKKEKMKNRYRYGNFNYFHRIQAPFQNDPRLDLMCDDWFKGKTVLDIGCNAGLLTLSVARMFSPKRILGIDIDGHLIGAARKNIRHFQDKEAKIVGRFPASFSLNLGPISGPSASTSSQFPENIWFRQENYVLDSDEKLEDVKGEFDVIMAWSISKYIHLNFGDLGMKRFFKRVYNQLLPGGRFLLEPQTKYRQRAKDHPELMQNFKSIKFWPDQFKEFLCGEVGFVHCEELSTPLVQQLGCEASIQMYYKGPVLWQNEHAHFEIEPPNISPFNNFQPSATPRAEDSQFQPDPQQQPTPPATPEDRRYERGL